MVRPGALIAGLVAVLSSLSGCTEFAFPGDDPAEGTLVRIVELDSAAMMMAGEPNDAADLLALAETRFEYTHAGPEMDSDDVTVRYQDDEGREREAPLSRFTSLDKVGRGDEVTLDGVLLTSRVEVVDGDRVLAQRGGPPQDWLEAGGYPLPLAADPDGFVAWDMDGEMALTATLDRLRVTSEDEDHDYHCEEVLDADGHLVDYRCETTVTPSTDTITVTGVAGEARTVLDATLSLEGTGTTARPRIEGVLDGSVELGSSLDSHVRRDRTGAHPRHMDADFGFDLSAEASGDGLARFTFGADRQLRAAGGSGDLLVTADLVAWDDEHPKAERWRPGGMDEPLVHESFPYTEEAVPSDEDPVAFVAEALADLWRMDLLPGDEFRASFDTGEALGMYGGGDFGVEGLVLIRVIAAEEKEVPAGTFDTLRIATTTEVTVDTPEGPQGIFLPSTTMWIDRASGVPVALTQEAAIEHGLDDLAPLLGLAEVFSDDVEVEEPTAMAFAVEGSTDIVLTEWRDGIRMAPMATVLSPFLGFGMPLGSLMFAPMGMLGGLGHGGNDAEWAPDISFSKDSAELTLTVVQADFGLDWSDFGLLEAAGCVKPSGPVGAGDVIDCSPNVGQTFTLRISHLPTNTLVYETTFVG